jgi:hypothetical protein
MTTGRKTTRRLIGVVAVPLLLLAACGNDDDTAATDNGDAATDNGESSEFCELAEQLTEQEDFPSEEQLERYKELAPAEISEDAQVVADAFIDAGPEGFGEIFADQDVMDRLQRIEDFEAEECGIESGGGELPDGVSTELDEDAQRVDVSAIEYDFVFDAPSAGAVSFVMSNDGEEAHYMGIGKLAEGVTLEEALEADDPDEVTEFTADSDVAAPGDEAVLTFEDLEAGEYGMVCFIPTPDGTPHAFVGMAVPFTVTE